MTIELNSRGDAVKNLQTALEKLGYVVPKSDLDQQLFGVGTRDAVLKLQVKYHLKQTGVFDDVTAGALARAVGEADTPLNRVEGRIVFEYGLAASTIPMRLYARAFGGSATRLVESKTDEQGYYTLPYNPPAKQVHIEVRAVESNGKEIPLSNT